MTIITITAAATVTPMTMTRPMTTDIPMTMTTNMTMIIPMTMTTPGDTAMERVRKCLWRKK